MLINKTKNATMELRQSDEEDFVGYQWLMYSLSMRATVLIVFVALAILFPELHYQSFNVTIIQLTARIIVALN